MHIRLSASTRFILAVLRLSADIAEGFGAAVIHILSRQYPDMKKEMAEDPQYAENAAASIGHKLVAIARKQLQYNEQDAYDAIQDLLTYIATSKFDFRAKTKKGKPGASTWRQALNNIYANLRARAMSHSFKKFRSGNFTDEERYADMMWRRNQNIAGNPRYDWTDDDDEELFNLGRTLMSRGVDVKSIVPTKLRRKNIRDKSIDEAFGQRGEEGGSPEGGLGRIPQTTETTEGMPIDEKAAKKNFLETIDEIIPDLRRSLPLTIEKLPAQRFLFDFIFEEDGPGTFLPDVKANMGQATAFRDYLEEISMRAGPNAEKAAAILKRYGKRWSGFVSDTRVRLMKSIQEFVEKYLPEHEYEQLWDEFFSDVSPQAADKSQLKWEDEQISYQHDLDLRKILRMQERDSLGLLSAKEKQDLNKLRKRLNKEISDEYQERVIAWNNYMDRMMQFSDLPLERQPKIKRPQRPKKPLTLDEQLKIMSYKEGDKIRRQVEEEFKLQLESDERKKAEDEEAKEIAEEAISEVDTRSGIATFFQRFLPEFA